MTSGVILLWPGFESSFNFGVVEEELIETLKPLTINVFYKLKKFNRMDPSSCSIRANGDVIVPGFLDKLSG